MSLIGSIQRTGLAPSVFIGNAISNAIKPGSGKTTTSQLQSTTAGKILGTSIALGVVGLGAAYAPSGAIAASARSLIPSTLKGKIIGAAALPVIGGILSTNPKAPIQAVSNLGGFGSDIGTFSANPSATSFIDILRGSPIISAGLGAAAVGLAGAAIIPAVASFANTRAIRENTRGIQTSGFPIQDQDEAMVTPLSSVAAPEELSSGSTPRRRSSKKSRSKARSQTISQRVDVRVNSVSGNRKYIKNVVHN